MTLVPKLAKLLGEEGSVLRLQHPKLDLVAILRRIYMKADYTSGRENLITK